MPFRINGKRRFTAAEDIVDHDLAPTQDHQQEFDRFMNKIKIENEFYLVHHQEIRQMSSALFHKMAQRQPRPKNVLKDVALHFTSLDPNFGKGIKSKSQVDEDDFSLLSKTLLEHDSLKKDMDHYKSKDPVKVESTNSTTSTFISIKTSESTILTPESTLSLEETTSEMIKSVISNMVNKAVYSQVTDDDITYDIAYVELKKAVEDAMEIPVVEIRADLADLLKMTLYMAEFRIEENERIAAQNTWEIKMKKKWKRRLRRQYNYKGYETEQLIKSEATPQSFLNSCKCPSQFKYNRYPKDRYGVYLPQDTAFSNSSVTAVLTVDDMIDQDGNYNIDTDALSQKSGATYKSILSTAFYAFEANRKLKCNKAASKTILNDDNSDVAIGLTSAHVILF